MNQKFTSTIAGASIFISLMALLSRSIGFVREIIFAGYFGTGSEFDLYLVGAVLPVTINNILLYIGQNFFIPGVQKLLSESKEKARKFYSRWFILFIISGILISLILLLLSDQIVNFYVTSASDESRITAAGIFKIFLITIPFASGVSILSAMLQTIYEYKYPASSVLFLNVSVILLILFFENSAGIYVIPIGYCLGTVLQFLYLMFRTEKYFKLSLNIHLKEKNIVNSGIAGSFLIIILIESISQLYTIFDRYFYGDLSAGGIASLNYAMIVWFMPVSILSVSLATAVFPKIANAINTHSDAEIEKIYNESISMNAVIFIPIAFVFFFYGDTIITIFFERGKFSSSSSLMTFEALRFYSLSLVFYSIYTVFNKIFYSLNLERILLCITIAGLIIKLIMNFTLIHLSQNGLALSTTISFIFFFLTSYLILNFKLRIKQKFLFIKKFSAHLLNGILCILMINILQDLFVINDLFSKIFSIILFLVFYTGNIIVIKSESLTRFQEMFKKINFGVFRIS